MKQVIKDNPDSEYVFSNEFGKPYSDISESWENACDRAGIKNLWFHDLRHTFCTRMAHEGVNPFTIMAVVGHKDTRTAKRYTNPTDEHLLAAISKVALKFHQNSQYRQIDSKLDSLDKQEKQGIINS